MTKSTSERWRCNFFWGTWRFKL